MSVRTGWPRTPEEYPPGYGVASPPGFCSTFCDCMDDARMQHHWEVHKAWLEDRQRTQDVKCTIEAFSRRSGVEVRGRSDFQTAQTKLPDQTHSRAALDL